VEKFGKPEVFMETIWRDIRIAIQEADASRGSPVSASEKSNQA